jgi:hypothetical protein
MCGRKVCHPDGGGSLQQILPLHLACTPIHDRVRGPGLLRRDRAPARSASVHGLDQDTVFTSIFWQELMRLTRAKMHMTMTFHPQPDGQTEAANKFITMYLRCFTGDRPRQWLR